MAKGKQSEEISVIAELTLSSPAGEEVVRSFDVAWHRSLELPMPVCVKLNGFVRKN